MVQGFPYRTLDHTIGIPTYDTIVELHRKINTNSVSVQSNIGGGAHDHLSLSITLAVCSTLSTVLYATPPNSGTNVTILLDAIGPQSSSIRTQFEDNTALFNKCQITDKALKQQIVAAIEAVCLKAIRNKYTVFGNQTCITMLQHMYNNYIKIDPGELAKNGAIMKAS